MKWYVPTDQPGIVDEAEIDMSGYDAMPRTLRGIMQEYHQRAATMPRTDKRSGLEQALRLTEELDKKDEW